MPPKHKQGARSSCRATVRGRTGQPGCGAALGSQGAGAELTKGVRAALTHRESVPELPTGHPQLRSARTRQAVRPVTAPSRPAGTVARGAGQAAATTLPR